MPGAVKAATKVVRPLMSTNLCQARGRTLALYRSFYRHLPYMHRYYDIPKSLEECRLMLRQQFLKNACVRDIRVIDLLVIKGCMEFRELRNRWMQKGRVMHYWEPTAKPKQTTFLGKFLDGHD